MKVAVYALTTGPAGRLALRGVAREGLRAVRIGPISAIVGNLRRPPAASEPNLRRYATLIGRVAATRRAVLPVRFGTIMDDEEELASVVRSRQQAIRRQLAHVRGRVQMTVRIVVSRAVSGSRTPDTGRPTGVGYLKARALEQRAESIPEFATLHQAVARWVKDERVERQGNVATVYHLIPAAAANRYADALERAAVAAGVQGFVSGPWPPYAFADRW